MPYVISHFFPEGTAEQYEAVMVAMNGELGKIPEGQVIHVAGPVPGGFQVIAVQQSRESWDDFMTNTFLPLIGNGIEGGFPLPPQALEFETSHVFR